MNINSSLSEKFPLIKKDEAELSAFAKKYPWCSIAQLSLLHHYKKSNSLHFDQQATKTALFFNNINWLNWQLHLFSKEAGIAESRMAISEIHEEPGEIENIEQPMSPANINEEIMPEEPETSPAPEIQDENIDQPIYNPSPVIDHKEEMIAFEPLHTTDYFASQGIKLTDEPVSNDKLGSQLKSFTEWLKSMKKIHHGNLSAGDEQTDKNIQQIAEHSNMDAEVVTEAMADVLVKQDKNQKAIEVYEKLSLIYPSKSAYFAAKIVSLSIGR